MNNQTQKATFNQSVKTKFTSSHRKEGKYYFESYSILIPSKYNKNNANAIIELRIYRTGNSNTACLWINDSLTGFHTSGSGLAGGYGYHRPSAAAQIAINNAGIELSLPIDGRGDSAIEGALKAIAKMLGHKKYLFFKAHQ